MDYLSHPSFPLTRHMDQVRRHAMHIVEDKTFDFTEVGVTRQETQELMSLIALLHDAGKYSTYFQHYIRERGGEPDPTILTRQEKRALKQNPHLKNHSLYSGVAFLALTRLLDLGWRRHDLLVYTGFYTILQHHGDLRNPNHIEGWGEQTVSDLEQVSRSVALDELSGVLSEHGFTVEPSAWQDEIQKVLAALRGYVETRIYVMTGFNYLFNFSPTGKEHFFFTFLFSTLIYADKYAAIFKTDGKEQTHRIPSDSVVRYKQAKGFRIDTDLNREREELFVEVDARVKDVDLDSPSLYTLTMNTGYGKTLTSFNFALGLRERLREEKGIQARIIYAMPFTSIIEQNFTVFQEVVAEGMGIGVDEVTEDILLKNHYLSQVRYQTRERFEYDVDKSKYLMETWESEVVFTTFVQLFELFLDTKNRKLTKLPSLVNSIVVLDEIQSLEPELQDLFHFIFSEVGRMFNIHIVLCSATQSYVHHETEALIGDEARYFQTERTELILPDGFSGARGYGETARSMDETLTHVKGILDEEEGKNALVILNTKKRALAFYQEMRRAYPSRQVILLSNSLIPRHKKEIIEKVREKMKEKDVILVSTQLIEAGVDLDFDIGFRDLCPLPSLIQSIGRVNRNFHHTDHYGKVHLLNIENDGKKVYSEELLAYTFDAFRSLGKGTVLEREYYDLNRVYYGHIREYFNKRKGSDLKRDLLAMRYAELDFRLIEEDKKQRSVFIEYDETARELWHRYVALSEHASPLDAKRDFYGFKAPFLDHVLSMNTYTLEKLLPLYGMEFDPEKQMIFIPMSIVEVENGIYTKESGIRLTAEMDEVFM